jgi:hypothetical protein
MRFVSVPKYVNVVVLHDKQYYSSFIDGKQCVVSFMNNQSATKCIQFMNEYKEKYAMYPILGENLMQVRTKQKMHFVYLKNMEVEKLQMQCMLFNVGLVGIDNFDYQLNNSKFTLEFGAADLLVNHQPTIQMNIATLNAMWDV